MATSCPDRATRPPRPATPTTPADGLLHRHRGLHRLQGLRGGVQGVERRPRGRADTHRHVLRQHRRPRRRHLAPRRVHRAAGRRGRGRTARRRTSVALADGVATSASTAPTPACLDVCPTGALFRTEFGTVVVQDDICNGCGYCVPACPYGVIDRREDDGRASRSARCATTGSAAAWSPPAPRPARPSRSSSAPSTSCASGPGAGGRRCTRPGVTEARLYGHDPERRRRRRRRLLPAARRTRGLRPAARPGRDHQGPAARCGAAPGSPPRPARRGRGRRSRANSADERGPEQRPWTSPGGVRQPCAEPRAPPDRRTTGVLARRAGRRGGDGAGREFSLLLRAAGHQGPAVGGPDIAGVSVPRRPGRGVVGAGRRAPS